MQDETKDKARENEVASSDLEILEDRLHKLKEELGQRIRAIETDVAGGLNPDSSEQVVELENAQVLDELSREATQELGEVTAALTRLRSGRYGVCVDCAERIDLERLHAYPGAARCIDCARTAG